MAKLFKLKISARSVPPELEGFGFRGVIDLIEIELTLATPSQWPHLKKRILEVWGNVYVKSLGPIESSTKFRIRVQDPRPADEFMHQVRLVAREGESFTENSVKITGVEIAIDARHPSNDPELLAQAALYLMRHQAHLPKGLPRITAPAYFDAPILAAKYTSAKAAHTVATVDAHRKGKEPPPRLPKKYGTCSVVESNRDALKALRRGLSINQGKAPVAETCERGDNYRARDYVKTKDTQDNVPYGSLPPKKHSARTERTWQDNAVPFTTIEEWRNFRFESLSRYFELVKPKAPATGLSALFQERMIQFGHSVDETIEALRPDGAIPKSCEPGYRHSKRLGFCADTQVNADIKTALRCLTLRSRVKIRKESGDTEPLPSVGKRRLDIERPKYINTNTARERKLKSATQSPLTSATPANNSCFLVIYSNSIPRQVHRQFGHRANQCGPPQRGHPVKADLTPETARVKRPWPPMTVFSNNW